MPLTDFWIVMRWWGTLFFVGATAFPLARALFPSWHDRGYLFAKSVGMATVSWIVFVFGMSHILPFGPISIAVAMCIVFVTGLAANIGRTGRGEHPIPGSGGRVLAGHAFRIAVEEILFFVALLLWAWVKAHEPSIRGLEKFMDYGFMQSIVNGSYFPPTDMWYPPFSVNYYYFGHLVTAMLTKLSGLDLAYTFNLMLATIFALCLTMSFSIGYQLLLNSSFSVRRKKLIAVFGGGLTAFLVTLAGNMQTLYAFTQGYTGDSVKPFWQLFWSADEFRQKLPEGLDRYWYANATRFIPFTIHEFPSYSFVVSDVHGHVLSIPFVLLSIGLLISHFGYAPPKKVGNVTPETWLKFGFYGFLCGVLLMTNALDGPIYLGLFLFLHIMLTVLPAIRARQSYTANLVASGVVLGVAVITALPFLSHFSSFVTGLAVNCPLPAFANSRLGPILFEGVEKCQKSPLWMMMLLWGFFWYCSLVLVGSRLGNLAELLRPVKYWNTKLTHIDKMLLLFSVLSVMLVIFPEFFYFKDIYPQHFRSNTMFKLGYQAFILWSVMSGYTLTHLLFSRRSDSGIRMNRFFRVAAFVLVIPQLLLVSIYPYFSVRSYFGRLEHYEGLYGLTWLAREYPDDYNGIIWLKTEQSAYHIAENEIIVEADGESYTDNERFSVFTGIPTIVGWGVHEWLWRGSYDAVSPRREDVRRVYESVDDSEVRLLFGKYHVRYVVVGAMERQKFPTLEPNRFARFGTEAFRSNDTVIYDVGAANRP